MLTLASTLTEERKQQIREQRSQPGHPMPHGLLQVGKEYHIRIKVTDDLAAEEVLLGLLNRPDETMKGHEYLGFEVQEVSWADANDLFVKNLDLVKEELSRFVQTELLQRISERGKINI